MSHGDAKVEKGDKDIRFKEKENNSMIFRTGVNIVSLV